MKTRYEAALLAAVVIFLMGVTSCSTPKDVAYFQDITDTTVLPVNDMKSITVRPGDKLSIIVKSKDPALSELFNLAVTASRVGAQANPSGGSARNYLSGNEGVGSYTVTPQGNIDFPVLGKLNVAGMTRSELAGFIKGELMGRNLLKDPVVTVEFMNIGISVIGEVTSPGRYDVNLDNLTLLDALSLAGDLTIQGQRNNIKVMRREADGLHTYVVDLTNMAETISSPAYSLQQGDIIYVEPNGMKKRQTSVNGNTALSASFWVSVASLLTSVAVLIFK